MDKIAEYLSGFKISYIRDCPKETSLSMFAKKICKNIKFYSLEDVLKTPIPNTHFLFFEISLVDKDKAILVKKIIKSTYHWDGILFSDNYRDYISLKLAISCRFIDSLPRKIDQKNLLVKYKNITSSLISKRKEKGANDQYKKIVDKSDNLYVIKKDNHPIFISEGFKERFKVDKPNEIIEIDKPIFRSLSDMDEPQKIVIYEGENGKESYLIDIKNLEVSGEQIATCIKIDNSISKKNDDKTSSRIKFIENLKDMLLERGVSNDNVLCMCIKVVNADRLIEEFAYDIFYDLTKEIINFVKEYLDLQLIDSNIWHRDYIVFMINDKNVKKVESFLGDIFDKMTLNKFTKDIVPFCDLTLVNLKSSNLNYSIALIEKFYSKEYTPEDGKYVVYRASNRGGEEADGKDKAMYYLENIYLKKHPIKLLNIYKGLSITTGSKIKKIKDGNIYVESEILQKYAMHIEKSVVMQSASLPRDMTAEVKYVDHNESFAILKNPNFLEFSANSRQYARVECDVRIPITLSSGRYTYTGEMLDLSAQAIAIKYKSNISRNIMDSQAKLQFKLPSKSHENGLVAIEIKGRVVAVNEGSEYNKVVVLIFAEQPYDGYLLEYIYMRQKELILEVKKLGSVAFKG